MLLSIIPKAPTRFYLSSNVLDTPELFWSEDSLRGLYGAVREYWEIDQRVRVLNQKLAVTTELVRFLNTFLSNRRL
jgi:uncharacterized Rmd1/YagE family protein